jgi:hypothetical protein
MDGDEVTPPIEDASSMFSEMVPFQDILTSMLTLLYSL